MCGIFGIWNTDGKPADPLELQQATRSLRHRGPDDEGYLLAHVGGRHALPYGGQATDVHLSLPRIATLFNEQYDLALGHRRLAIIDLSSSGHQPMSNEDETNWIVYNGEIYNYPELRKELLNLGHRFRSQTDTEVILHAYEEWDTNCLSRFNGMWAFALIDLRRRRLFCSRDRMGVKPFYYLYDGKRFSFASEIKAFLKLDNLQIKPNEQIVADYLFSGIIDHTQETFFEKIYQLRPGQYLLLESDSLNVRSYWDIEPREIHLDRNEDHAGRFLEILEDSIRLRLRSDVPIGTCLSGGLDSSSIVCLANRLMFDRDRTDPGLVGERQKTFSSCFDDARYDERHFIEKVIELTGAERNYVFPRPEMLLSEVPQLIWHQDEPFGSTSIYAQWCVTGKTRDQGVKVLLDGQGGDELLAGYLPSFYPLFGQTIKQVNLRQLLREIKGFRKNHRKEERQLIPSVVAAMIPNSIRPLAQNVVKRGVGWADENFRKRYFRKLPRLGKFDDDVNNYLYHLFRNTSLPGLLHYEDRNGMAFSVETRLPFLDYRLVEYVFSLPAEKKISEGVTKVILRKAMMGILPEAVRNRHDKMGFVTPEDIWFRTTLRDPVYKIINSKSFTGRGYMEVGRMNQAFRRHCEGKINISSTIWRWVNLELWLRRFVDQTEISIN